MIKLCNTEFYNVQHVKRAFHLLSVRNKEKCNLSPYEAKLGKAMYKYLNDQAYENISGRE